MLPIHTILHPTDFSEGSRFALGLACALARDYGARLIALHVAMPPVTSYGGEVIIPPPENYREPLLEELHGLHAPDGSVRVEHRLVEGDAATEIVQTAQEVGADVIVMGTHGRSGLGRLLMGSVAEQVLRKAGCPVVTVKVPPVKARASERVSEAQPVVAG